MLTALFLELQEASTFAANPMGSACNATKTYPKALQAGQRPESNSTLRETTKQTSWGRREVWRKTAA